jgi:uncharacterized repeat protein (TIGR02543 family)
MKKNLMILSVSLLLTLSGCNDVVVNSSVTTTSSRPAETTSSQKVNSETPKAKFTVTFDSNGGSAVEAQVVEEGTTASKPADPTKAETDEAAYVFDGWYLGETAYDFSHPVTENITLVAHWKTVSKFAVTFDSAGGSPVASQIVLDGEKASKPSDPTKAETNDAVYTFAGWYLGEDVFNFDTPVTRNITLVAHWSSIAKFAVTFDAAGGSAVATQYVREGEKAVKPNDPVKGAISSESYSFLGWFLGETEYDFSSAVTAAITLVAHWKVTAIHNDAHTDAEYVPFTLNNGNATMAYYRCKQCYEGNNEEHSYYSDAALKNAVTAASLQRTIGYAASTMDAVPEKDGIRNVVAEKIKYADQCTAFGQAGGTPSYQKIGSDTAIMISRSGENALANAEAKFTELRFVAPAKITSYSFEYLYLDSSSTPYETGVTEGGVSSETKSHDQVQYKTASGYFAYDAKLVNDGAWHTFTLNQTKEDISHLILKIYDFKGVLFVKNLRFEQYADIAFQYQNAAGEQKKEERVNYGQAASAPEAGNYESNGVSYTFLGWYDDPVAGNKVENFVVNGDKTYYAHYAASTIYEHIESVAPTATRPGVKESWINLSNQEVSLSAPAKEGNIVREKTLSEEELAALPSSNANYIAPGDFDAWLYQSDTFATQLIGGEHIGSVAANYAERAFRFHCGQDAADKSGSAHLGSNSYFYLQTKLLKTAHDLGYSYVNYTVKASSVTSDWTANHYAIVSQGNTVTPNFWTTNYTEQNAPLEKGVTFTLPLEKYNGFVGDDAKDYLQFNIRNSTAPTANSVESNVVLSDIRFLKEDYSSFIKTQVNLSSVLYTIDSNGVVNEATFYYNETESGGYAKETGFTDAYTKFLMKKGFLKAKIDVECTLDTDHGDSSRFRSSKKGGMGYDLNAGSYDYALEEGNDYYFGIPYNGGGKQQGGTIHATLTLRDWVEGNLQQRLFKNDTATCPYGIDATTAATATGGTWTHEVAGEGSGGIGDTQMSDGAAILVLSGGKSASYGGRFFAYHLNILDYAVPKDGDIVVFKKGIYEDPTNKWNIVRKLTLGADLYYRYSATYGAFVDATLAEAQAAGYSAN